MNPLDSYERYVYGISIEGLSYKHVIYLYRRYLRESGSASQNYSKLKDATAGHPLLDNIIDCRGGSPPSRTHIGDDKSFYISKTAATAHGTPPAGFR